MANPLLSLLAHDQRSILSNNTDDQVNITDLQNKTVGLYFSSFSCEISQSFTPHLIKVYQELILLSDFEIIFISLDNNEESFQTYFSTMPWLAIRYFDQTARDNLIKLYGGKSTPHLVLFDQNGDFLRKDGCRVVNMHGALAYPFTDERLKTIKEEEEYAKMNQTLRSILVSPSRDFLISNNGKQIPVSELEGKIVGLYFSLISFRACQKFTPTLVEIYHQVKNRGESFEVVLISFDKDEESFNNNFKTMPWLAIPFNDRIKQRKLSVHFQLRTIPTLVIIAPDGKTLNPNVARYISLHGIKAYPFSPESLEELDSIDKARRESQTLESLLVTSEQDFVEGKGGVKVSVSELKGKIVLFYFSRKQCPPCRLFTPKLAEAYNEIKSKHDDFELIWVSCDNDQDSYIDYYSTMPWLAIPYGDDRENSLKYSFDPSRLPYLVAIGPTGQILTQKARELVTFFGSNAYPFDEQRFDEMEFRLEEMAKGLPETVRNVLHPDHDLVKSRAHFYSCGKCNELAIGWAFSCDECHYYLHPKCALQEENMEGKNVSNVGDDAGQDHVDGSGTHAGNSEDRKDELVCDGAVCHKE